MRWYILKALLQKEALRHAANRTGLVTSLVLILAAAVLTLSGRGTGLALLSGQVECCYIDYWQDGPWIAHLRGHVLPDLAVRFRAISEVAVAGETICYPAGAGAIQMRGSGDGAAGTVCKIWIWYPGSDSSSLARFEAWFWQESTSYFRQRSSSEGRTAAQHLALPLEVERSSLAGAVDPRTTAAMALVLFAIFFPCAYLLPSWSSEERERGVLMAVALSPATALEIQSARALFYGLLGTGLAVLVTAINCPHALGSGFYWVSLFLAVLGALGVGSAIAALVCTQRTASLVALGYLLGVALFLSAAQVSGLSGLSWLALEFHLPRILGAALSGTDEPALWANAAAAAGLALAWIVLAVTCFRRRGWQ
jgi:hypothetical protein